MSNGDGRIGDYAGGGFGGRYDNGWGGWWNGRLTEEDIRQLRGEARQYYEDAQQLRRDVRGVDIDPRDLEETLKMLQQLQDERVYQDAAELTRLQKAVAERLKRFEFALRREVGDDNAVALSGADEVPEGQKALVEEYFRSIARPKR